MSPSFVLDRHVDAAPERVWELWTTAAGIEQWWAPDGFTAELHELELRVGGPLRFSLTATGRAQVEFMHSAGLPLSNESRKTFTEISPPARLAYTSLVDFVPDHEPYEQLTVVELAPDREGTAVRMTAEPMHDDVWTERLIAGRENELANLAALLARD